MTTTATATTSSTPSDSLGVEFRVDDRVMVNAWGAPVRLIDTGKRAVVTGFTRSGNVRLDCGTEPDPIANGSAVRPGYLAVLRRDGAPGFEGNRLRCVICGDPLDAATGAGRRATCAAAHTTR